MLKLAIANIHFIRNSGLEIQQFVDIIMSASKRLSNPTPSESENEIDATPFDPKNQNSNGKESHQGL